MSRPYGVTCRSCGRTVADSWKSVAMKIGPETIFLCQSPNCRTSKHNQGYQVTADSPVIWDPVVGKYQKGC